MCIRDRNITLNSINTEVSRDEKRKLYSDLGLLYPQGHQELAMAEDFDQIKVRACTPTLSAPNTVPLPNVCCVWRVSLPGM